MTAFIAKKNGRREILELVSEKLHALPKKIHVKEIKIESVKFV